LNVDILSFVICYATLHRIRKRQLTRLKDSLQQCFSTFLVQRNLPKMFALLKEPYAMTQMSVLLQPHGTVVANFVPGNFGLLRRNPQPVAYAENKIFMGGSFSGIWWSFVFGVRCLWRHNLMSYSCFQTNVFAKFVT